MAMDYRILMAALLIVAACGGNPYKDDEATDPGTTPVEPGEEGIHGDVALPPGTTAPTPSSRITRYEARGGNGNGLVTNVSYNAEADTFMVDGLAFDGDNIYRRGASVSALLDTPFREKLGSVAVYEGKPRVPDGFTGTPIDQITPHRAIYGVNADQSMSFAVVRTGGYVGYGFGGFLYQRTGGVTLPAPAVPDGEYKGQAHYTGKMASLRDFSGRAGANSLEYGTGDMAMEIDFDDFNDGGGVKGSVFNRRVYDINGNDITDTIVAAMRDAFPDADAAGLPTLSFVIQPGVMDKNGEIAGTLTSNLYDSDGVQVSAFESGTYYAVVGGANAQNVVGILVAEGADPRWAGRGVTVRETGGFILVRE